MTYQTDWAHMYSGCNARRAERWRLVAWNDIRPGDVVNFIDEEGRYCARRVARASASSVTTEPVTYSGHTIADAVEIFHLTKQQARSGRGTGVAFFRYAERARRTGKRPFKPLTL